MSDHLGEKPSWCKTTLVKKPILMQDHLGENPSWCKITLMKTQPDARPHWWKPSLMQDQSGLVKKTHPDSWKTTLMRDSVTTQPSVNLTFSSETSESETFPFKYKHLFYRQATECLTLSVSHRTAPLWFNSKQLEKVPHGIYGGLTQSYRRTKPKMQAGLIS